MILIFEVCAYNSERTYDSESASALYWDQREHLDSMLMSTVFPIYR